MGDIEKIKERIVLILSIFLIAGCSVNLEVQPPNLKVGENGGVLLINPYVGCWEHGFFFVEVSCNDMVIDENNIIGSGSKQLRKIDSLAKISFSSGPLPNSLKYDIYEIENGRKSRHILSGNLDKFPQVINLSAAAGKDVYVDFFAKWGDWGDAYYVFTAAVAP